MPVLSTQSTAPARSLLSALALVLVLASCGSDGSSDGTDESTAPTATTTTAAPNPTSTAAPPSTVAETTAASATAAPTTEETSATTEDTDAADTMATSATVVATTDAADTTTAPSVAPSEYSPVPSPIVPTQTSPVDASGNHPDGVYYASVSETAAAAPEQGHVAFELVQLFTGQACIDHFGDEDEDACVGDYGVETEPTSTVDVDVDGVFISVVDAATKQSYRISGDELNELLIGGNPAEGAPADYLYSGFGYLVTYEGGSITRLEQWWTP